MNDPLLLLCTDMDRTLLPNGTQPESQAARQRFSTLVSHPGVVLVYVTGRDKSLVERAINNYGLPWPDLVISDVGTNIYHLENKRWQVWPQWPDEIGKDWNGRNHQHLSELLSGIQALRMQEYSKQNTFKLSFYYPLHTDNKLLDEKLSAILREKGIDASLIWSIDEPAGVGLLDILPKRATKLHAVEFLQNTLGIPLSRTLFAGDSGNDLQVLTSAIPSVLVANAIPTVVDAAIKGASAAGTSERLYLARGDFLDMNGNYSAGILEGVNHFRPELTELFAEDITRKK
ncbi:MAG: HAD-IIB family hydrolase [Gammaproteobacteria bacterium]|nr:HAD-IIB family hydrolase [Gammaproteobacteria bacterium]